MAAIEWNEQIPRMREWKLERENEVFAKDGQGTFVIDRHVR